MPALRSPWSSGLVGLSATRRSYEAILHAFGICEPSLPLCNVKRLPWLPDPQRNSSHSYAHWQPAQAPRKGVGKIGFWASEFTARRSYSKHCLFFPSNRLTSPAASLGPNLVHEIDAGLLPPTNRRRGCATSRLSAARISPPSSESSI
jgi:hypothetical protein